jgi:NAD(P)-dependent dehydrogenase (short-subunit alcohol dehydrogenase family)
VAQHTVIIGGTSGIGLATARQLATTGHTVTIAGRDADRLKAALERLHGEGAEHVTGHVADATDPATLDALFATTGPIQHVVVTVTAYGGIGPISELTVEQLRRAVDGKLVAHVNVIKAAQPYLSGDGSITLVSAASAQTAMPGTAALAAVNGAIDRMVPVLAVELAPVRVNAVSPGVIDTEWWDWLPAEARAEAFASFCMAAPAGRVGQADDVAHGIVFLIGNSFSTGIVLPLDGGLRLKPVG